MSQASLSIPNSSGATLRQNVSNALQALGSMFSGASAPSTTYAFMLWADTTTGQIKMRDSSNAAWIILWEIAGLTLPPIGSARNLKASLTAAAASVSFTADECIVGTALGGSAYRLASINLTLNTATTGAGGMDTGSAPTSGYLAIYLIYNPTTKTKALLGTNATSGAASTVYSGGSMPSGYTASALLSVWPTDGTNKLKMAAQRDRTISFAEIEALYTNGNQGSYTSLSISGAVPFNAVSISGYLAMATGAAAHLQMWMAADANGLGVVYLDDGSANATLSFCNFLLTTAQQVYWKGTISAGTPYIWVRISQYTI